MFRMSHMTPAKLAGIIEVERPIHQLGFLTDIHGNKWDIHGIIGNYVQACPKDQLHPYYTDTSGQGFGLVQQTWQPYGIKIVRDDDKYKDYYEDLSHLLEEAA